MAPRIVFVLSPYQNAFFVEIVEALTAELHAADVPVVTTTEPDRHAVRDDDVFVLVPPHEYIALEGAGFLDDPVVAARTVGISAEQPHQSFFERNADIGARLGAVMDFSELAIDAYRRAGVDATHLPFGYVPAWDRSQGSAPAGDREIPMLYLGNKRPRRLRALAGAADVLFGCRAELLISDNEEPNTGTSATFVAGEDKRDLLARTRLLVNVHQSDEPYFEWLRFAEAAHCRTPMLCEHSVASAPFADGEHYLGFDLARLGPEVDQALADTRRLDEIAQAAYERLRAMPLAASLPRLVDTARSLLGSPPPHRLPARTRGEPIGRDRSDPTPTAQVGTVARLRAVVPGKRRWVLVAPPGTRLRAPIDELVAATGATGLMNIMVSGRDEYDAPMLEGIWPWQPWRLRHGQHLGRVIAVQQHILDAARAWLPDGAFDGDPHLVVQLYAAVHGLRGEHLARPGARAEGWIVDPSHAIVPSLAARCREMLAR